MAILQNKFAAHTPEPTTEILILGTFSFNNEQSGDFFYGKSRQFLWHMLPGCYQLPSLMEADVNEKKQFIKKYHIDFLDVVKSIEWDDEDNLPDEDQFDSTIKTFNDVAHWVNHLPNLKAIYFTRKTFNGIPNIKENVKGLSDLAFEMGIRFCKLETPARHYSFVKQKQWIETIVLGKTCLRV